jgi:SAM-dependent methyltransferase
MDVREYWSAVGEEIAARPDRNPAAGDRSPYIRYLNRLVVTEFFDQLSFAGRSVLEVGCGPGGKLRLVWERGPSRLVGADVSPVMLDLARERFAGTPVEIVALDSGPYPFRDREFDLVFTCTVLHHNPGHAVPRLLAEIARVSAEDVVLIESTAPESQSPGPTFHRRPVDWYATILDVHGFALDSARPVGTAVSEVMSALAMRLAHSRKLGRPPYQEGKPAPRLRIRLEQGLLPVTRRLDRMVPQRVGLSEMRFSRR